MSMESNTTEGNSELQKAFGKIASSYDYGENLPNINLDNNQSNWLIVDLSLDEICAAIKYSKKYSAPGA